MATKKKPAVTRRKKTGSSTKGARTRKAAKRAASPQVAQQKKRFGKKRAPNKTTLLPGAAPQNERPLGHGPDTIDFRVPSPMKMKATLTDAVPDEEGPLMHVGAPILAQAEMLPTDASALSDALDAEEEEDGAYDPMNDDSGDDEDDLF